MTYNVKLTDKNILPIAIDENTVNITNDISLFGRTKLEYGQDMNANLLHILENFACQEDTNNIGNPDLTKTSTVSDSAKKLLSTPVIGQTWFNKTQNTIFVWDGNLWIAVSSRGDIAVNWGAVCNGEQLPRPVSSTGYVFTYGECAWIVGPKFTDQSFDNMVCYTDDNAVVTMYYGDNLGGRSGIASYMIVGIKGNYNHGGTIVVNPPSATVTPTPTITLSPTSGASPTPVATMTRTPFPTSTPAPTPAAGTPVATPTPTATVTTTPGITPTQTADPTVTPTVTADPSPTPAGGTTPTPTPTTTGTAAVTPSATAPVTPTATVTPTPTQNPTPTPTPSLSYTTSISLDTFPTLLEAYGIQTPGWVQIVFATDGTWTTHEKSVIQTGTWLTSGVAANYEYFYTYTSFTDSPDNGDPGDGQGIWHDFAAGFYVNDNDYTTSGRSVYLTLTIRRKADHADTKSIDVTIDVDGGCFAVGTELLTANGDYAKVENIVVGQALKNFYIDGMIDEAVEDWQLWTTTSLRSMVLGESTVKKTRKFTADSAIAINGTVTTLTHTYFVYDGKKYCWKHADQVLITDMLANTSGRKVAITEINVINTPTEFVAIDVENVDTLIVKSVTGDDILAHNASA